MNNPSEKYQTIDEYIAMFSTEEQKVLKQFREVIHNAAPEAVEAIKYMMPTFVFKGKNLVHFAVLKNHYGFYPTPSGIEAYKKELERYVSTKGAIQFPKSEPVPFDLVKKITEFRKKETLERLSK